MPPLAPPFIYIFTFVMGTIFGSFLNVCIARIPEEESVVQPRSHCPQCKTFIAWYDNIPLFSFMLLGGQCRKCKGPISGFYPLIEALTGFLALLCVWKFQFSLQAALWFLSFICPLVVISFIDLKHFLIPDIITLPFTILGMLVHMAFFHSQPFLQRGLDSLFGIFLGAGSLWIVAKLYEFFKKQEGLGLGDVKLMAMLGAFLGARSILFIFLFSSFLASILSIFLMIFAKYRLKSALPYGPFLALGGLLHLFFGSEILRAYFHWIHSILH